MNPSEYNQPQLPPQNQNQNYNKGSNKTIIIIVSIVAALLLAGGVTAAILLTSQNKQSDSPSQNQPTNGSNSSSSSQSNKPSTSASADAPGTNEEITAEINKLAQEYIAAIEKSDETTAKNLTCDPDKSNGGLMYVSTAPQRDKKVTLGKITIVNKRSARADTIITIGSTDVDFGLPFSYKNKKWCVPY